MCSARASGPRPKSYAQTGIRTFTSSSPNATPAELSWPRPEVSSGAETSNASLAPSRRPPACAWPPASRCSSGRGRRSARSTGFTLHIDAIDPTYTLGDLEARKREIRERLRAEGIFDRNRQLPAPWDFRVLLVVSPPRAAGLGDFARDADRLQRHRVCETVYTHSRFEGEDASALIREAIERALATWTAEATPDAIVIICGGGAVNDLAWLNDYELARFVCLSPVPVLTGIGHERDNTVLDEVAHQRFDTPSKVIAGIQSVIVKRARESQEAFDELARQAERQLRTARAAIDQANGSIERQAVETIGRARANSQGDMAVVQRNAQRSLHDASQGAWHALSDVRAGAGGRLATARARSSALMNQVEADATAGVRNARREIKDAGRDEEAAASTRRNVAASARAGVADRQRMFLPRSRQRASDN